MNLSRITQQLSVRRLLPILLLISLFLSNCSKKDDSSCLTCPPNAITTGTYQLVSFTLNCEEQPLPYAVCYSAATQYISIDNQNQNFCLAEANSTGAFVYAICRDNIDEIAEELGFTPSVTVQGNELFVSTGTCSDGFSFSAHYHKISSTPLSVSGMDCQ